MSTSESPLTPEIVTALERFAGPATSASTRKEALSVLIETKTLLRCVEDPRVRAGREQLLAETRAPDQLTRLLGIAECVRLTQVVKKWAAELPAQLEEAFMRELPPIEALSDAADRLNVVRACGMMRAPWLRTYLSNAIAAEDTGEKARAEALRVLATHSTDLCDLLRLLADAFEASQPGTENPGDTIARRLTRTFVALRELLLDSEMETGDHFGVRFEELLSRALLGRRPQTERVQSDLVREALFALHNALRTQLPLIVDASAYKAVSYCRRLCGGSSWPADTQRATENLISDVVQALLLVGRQGRRDQGMIDNLLALTNFPERARAISSKLAETHTELPEEVREWLATGKVRTTRVAGQAAIEASASSADEAIGLALQDARSLRMTSDAISGLLVSNLELLDPGLAAASRDLFAQVNRATIQVEQVAALRSIALLGSTGEKVDAAPKYFDVLSDRPSPVMTVRQPAVVRVVDGRISEVIVKGTVE